jgi:hypothetical protein
MSGSVLYVYPDWQANVKKPDAGSRTSGLVRLAILHTRSTFY